MEQCPFEADAIISSRDHDGQDVRVARTNRWSSVINFFESAALVGRKRSRSSFGRTKQLVNMLRQDEVRRYFDSAADRAERAIARKNARDHTEAEWLWAIVLGAGFPTV